MSNQDRRYKFTEALQIKNILGLCSEDECKWHKNIEKDFICKRIVLPDSRKKNLPSKPEIDYAYNTLKKFCA